MRTTFRRPAQPPPVIRTITWGDYQYRFGLCRMQGGQLIPGIELWIRNRWGRWRFDRGTASVSHLDPDFVREALSACWREINRREAAERGTTLTPSPRG
jgi:hypothetical protein